MLYLENKTSGEKSPYKKLIILPYLGRFLHASIFMRSNVKYELNNSFVNYSSFCRVWKFKFIKPKKKLKCVIIFCADSFSFC